MKKNHQADLPKCIYRNIENIAKSKMEKAKADLLTGAAWFSIRRYEYCKTPRGDKKQTRAVELEGVVFCIIQRITHHTSRLLHKPTAIYINLKYQKKGKHEDHYRLPQQRCFPMYIRIVGTYSKACMVHTCLRQNLDVRPPSEAVESAIRQLLEPPQ